LFPSKAWRVTSSGVRSNPERVKPAVALIQRAIAHYRFPLFKKLSEGSALDWTFFCDDHDQDNSTGLAAPELRQLPVRQIHNRSILGPFVYQSGIKLRKFDALMLDLGWTLLSNPRYLCEAKIRRISSVGWSKGISQSKSNGKALGKRLYQRFILGLCDALVVYGRISKEYFLNLGFPENRIFVAQNTVDTHRIHNELALALKQKDSLLNRIPLNGRFVFGYLGGLVARKKVEVIIEAFNYVRSHGHDATLVIAGGGPSEPALRSVAESSPFQSDIHLVGRIPIGEEGGWFQLFDAYLSYAEGGLGILESMAHGKTVVSTPERFPETELLEDERTALISSDFSMVSFASRMLDAVKSRDSLAAIGNRAKETVLRRATLEKMAEAITTAVQTAMLRRHQRN
jgi:glycosyltransferase involved in cell wall biosynthesis